MKPRTAKLLLLAGTAAVGALSDVTATMAAGAVVNAPRSVLIGLALGIVVRGFGAALAYLVQQAAATEPPASS